MGFCTIDGRVVYIFLGFIYFLSLSLFLLGLFLLLDIEI